METTRRQEQAIETAKLREIYIYENLKQDEEAYHTEWAAHMYGSEDENGRIRNE